MRKLQFFILLLSACVTMSAFATQSFTRKSSSSVKEVDTPKEIVKTVVNTSYAFDSLSVVKGDDLKVIDVLLAKKVTTTSLSGREGDDSTLEVTAWVDGKGKYDTKLWTIRDSSDKGETWGDFYKTTKYACCGGEDVHRAYDINTGKYAFSFSTDPVSIDVPNTYTKRTIAYTLASTLPDYANGKRYKNAIGALIIWGNGSIRDRLVLESDDTDNDELVWSPTLSLVDAKEPKGTSSLSLWQSNGISGANAISGFSVKVVFGRDMEVVVPVDDDEFDIKHAVTPKSISIERVPMP